MNAMSGEKAGAAAGCAILSGRRRGGARLHPSSHRKGSRAGEKAEAGQVWTAAFPFPCCTH